MGEERSKEKERQEVEAQRRGKQDVREGEDE